MIWRSIIARIFARPPWLQSNRYMLKISHRKTADKISKQINLISVNQSNDGK
jgi:hypothetical protein